MSADNEEMRLRACAKMDKNKAYPSETPYFYGMTKEENAALPYPLPLVEECDVTVYPEGEGFSWSRKPGGPPRKVLVPADLFVKKALREAGLTREQANIIWI